jgi:hypothetical protein
MLSILRSVSGSKLALVLVSVVVILSVVDSQFIKVFYGTDFGTPGPLHMSQCYEDYSKDIITS